MICPSDKIENKEEVEILSEFVKKLMYNMVDLDPEIAKLVNEHFWKLFEPFD